MCSLRFSVSKVISSVEEIILLFPFQFGCLLFLFLISLLWLELPVQCYEEVVKVGICFFLIEL